MDGDPAEPQSWNRFAYVTDQPLTETDPTGLSPMSTYGRDPTVIPDYLDMEGLIVSTWRYAPGSNTGVWGLGSFLSGSSSADLGRRLDTLGQRSPSVKTASSVGIW